MTNVSPTQVTQPQKAFCSAHDDPCGGFMAIPPLASGPDGKNYINPDFDYIKKFHVAAVPFEGADATVGPGLSRDFALTVPAEENHLGDLLISELRAQFLGTPGTPVTGIFIELLSLQNDRLFTNSPVENSLMWGDGFLNNCMPCCTLLQATNTMIIRVTNTEAVDVLCRFVAVGKRFLPYHYPELRARILSHWNTFPCTPYWLNLDVSNVVLGAVGSGTENQTVFMTVPGGGDFLAMWPRANVIVGGAGTNPDTDIFVSIAEGVGRRWETQPLPLGLETTIGRAVAGMPNEGFYSAANALSCPQVTQLFKRNTRVRVELQNRGADTADVRFCIVGCMLYVGECAPGRSLDRIRSLEPTVGPWLIQQGFRCPPPEDRQMVPVPGHGFVPVARAQQIAAQQRGMRPMTPSYGQPSALIYGSAAQTGFRPTLGGMNGHQWGRI